MKSYDKLKHKIRQEIYYKDLLLELRINFISIEQLTVDSVQIADAYEVKIIQKKVDKF